MAARQILSKLLSVIARENGYHPCSDISIKQISSGGANYTSEIFTAEIKSPNKDDLKLFAKVAIIKDKMRAELKTDIFETENYFYTRMSKIFKELQDEHGVDEADRWKHPKFYGINREKYEESVVLEDLAASGYQNCDRFKTVDWEFASVAMTGLAKFHALTFAFHQKYPEEFNEFDRKTKALSEENDQKKANFNKMVETGIKDLSEEDKSKVKRWLDGPYLKNITQLLNGEGTPAFIHGDYKPSNMMYKKLNGELEIMTLDFQTLRSGYPAFDIVYFIISGTNQEFRRNHLKNLLDHYYTQLRTSSETLGLNVAEICPRSDFDKNWELYLPYGLILALHLLPLITVDEKNAPNLNDKDANAQTLMVKPNELFATRMKEIIDDYTEWGILK